MTYLVTQAFVLRFSVSLKFLGRYYKACLMGKSTSLRLGGLLATLLSKGRPEYYDTRECAWSEKEKDNL